MAVLGTARGKGAAAAVALLMLSGALTLAQDRFAQAEPSVDATKVPLPEAPSGSALRPAWPSGDFAGSVSQATNAKSGQVDARASSPGDGDTVEESRPRLAAAPQEDAKAYEFTIVSRGKDGSPGQRTSSGWIGKPRWTPPAGLLKDDNRYAWTVRAKDAEDRPGEAAPARELTVDLPLGAPEAGGPQASDSLGPVTVGLPGGNVSVSVNTPQVPTGSGVQGATFTYDSGAVAASAGLTGSYYKGGKGRIDSGAKAASVRTDARLGFQWDGQTAPYQGAEPGAAFRARWEGQLQVPSDGTYRLGGTYDGGMRVSVDGRTVVDDWRGSHAGEDTDPVQGKKLKLEAGQKYDLTVEYRTEGADKEGGGAFAELWAGTEGHEAPVPASWVSPSSEVLPPGWSVTPKAEGASAERAANATRDPGTTVAGSDDAGSSEGVSATPSQGDSDAANAQSATAGAAGTGQAGEAGPGGSGDEGGPVSAPERLRARIAEAEKAGLTFLYAGDKGCAEDSAAPKGHVCGVRLPGAGTMQLQYQNGKLVRFVNPGREVTDLGFSENHLLSTVRPPLVTDWISAGEERDTAAASYEVDYRSGTPAAASLTGPEPSGSPDGERPRRGYSVSDSGDKAQVTVAGLNTEHGWARSITTDDAGMLRTDTDATGRTTRHTWTADGQSASVTEPGGRKSTTVYNKAGAPAGSYGPGPAKCFREDGRLRSPAPSGCERVPAETTTFGAKSMLTERADSDGVPALQMKTELGASGMPSAMITDPDGLALRTGYESDKLGRPTAEVQPNGTSKRHSYYGASEKVDNPCTKEDDPAPQRGQLKAVSLPDPASGKARTERFVYGVNGLQVAVNFGGEKWTCVEYDDRGRMTRMDIPGNKHLDERTVRYDSAADGDPLTLEATQHDHSMSLTVDLLDRPVRYVDGQGTSTETAYDRAGRAVQERVTPPSDGESTQVKTTSYDASGRERTVTLDGQRLADAEYDTAGDIRRVRYGNGTRLTVDRDAAGRVTAKDWTLKDGSEQRARVKRSRSGTIVDESVAGEKGLAGGPDFVYDDAGRLKTAWMGGHVYKRDFTGGPSDSCPKGTHAKAGANSNVLRLTEHSASGSSTIGYCYDAADRLLATTGDGDIRDVKYATNGHLTGYRTGDHRVTQRNDTSERHLGTAVTGPGMADVTYTQDIADHLMSRTAKTSHGTETFHYGHTDMADVNPDLVLNEDRDTLARVVGLPGGAVVTLPKSGERPTAWSHSTVRGDIFLLTGEDGKRTGGPYRYGLFGEPLAGKGSTADKDDARTEARNATDVGPDNLPGSWDYRRLGQYQAGTEHAGAAFTLVLDTRVLNPAFGRFSAPVAAGPFHSAYEYAAGDPINHTSIDGFSLDVEEE